MTSVPVSLAFPPVDTHETSPSPGPRRRYTFGWVLGHRRSLVNSKKEYREGDGSDPSRWVSKVHQPLFTVYTDLRRLLTTRLRVLPRSRVQTGGPELHLGPLPTDVEGVRDVSERCTHRTEGGSDHQDSTSYQNVPDRKGPRLEGSLDIP